MPDDSQRPLKVFLCHAHADREPVRGLYVRLKREGVDVWLDKEKLLPGADWEFEIRKAVREADVVVVCLSKQFNQAGFRQKEVRIALDAAMEKIEGEIFIIPARLEECDNLESLNRWHWVDLFEGDGFQRLILALRVRADKIGAALRQRKGGHATISRPKINAEELEKQRAIKEQAERETVEKVRLETEELEKQKTVRENAEKEAVEKKLAETPREIPNNKIQQKSETPPPANNFPEGWEAEWQPALEWKKSSTKQESTEKLEPPAITKKNPRKWNTLIVVPTIIIGFSILIALFTNWTWNQWFVPRLVTITPTNTVAFAPAQPTLTKVTSTLTFTPASPTKTKAPILVPTATPLPTEITDDKDVTMRLVPAGEFTMGSEKYDNEKPVHQVTLDDFYMDKYEVTNALYKACEKAGGCTPPKQTSSYTHSSYYGNSEFDNYPVIYVDWNQAKTYCEWRNASLPTEAQWEKAARGADERTYPWGNDASNKDLLNYLQNVGDTTAVGSYESGKSPYGIYDLAGNVWEWVDDWYDGAYYQSSPSENPLGPDSGTYRVLRGGSWLSDDGYVRSADRNDYTPDYFGDGIGFRCARSLP